MRINKNGINSIIQSLNSRLIHVYIIWYECGITCMFILYECLWHHCKFDLTVTFWGTTFQWITLDIYEHNLNNEQKFFIPDFGSYACPDWFKVVILDWYAQLEDFKATIQIDISWIAKNIEWNCYWFILWISKKSAIYIYIYSIIALWRHIEIKAKLK